MPTALPAVGRADGVAAVLDQPEVVLRGERGDGAQVERVAQRVRDHDGPRPRREGRLELATVEVVGRQVDVDEDGHQPVLDDRVDRGREAGGGGDDLVAGLQPARRRAWARSGR